MPSRRPARAARRAARHRDLPDAASPTERRLRRRQPAASATAAPAAGRAPATAADSQWLKYDPATKTVTFRLVAGPFDFNGYTNGEATLTVPPRQQQRLVNFVQNDGTPHSAEVAVGDGADAELRRRPGHPAGLHQQGGRGIAAGGHGRHPVHRAGQRQLPDLLRSARTRAVGMWIWLKVDPAAKAPSFGPTPK